MSRPKKISLSGLPRGELEALAERLLAENAALRQAIAELRAEVATLKCVKGRPKVRPSGMEKATEPEPPEKGRGDAVSGYVNEPWVLPHIACFGWDDGDRMSI